MDSGVCEKRSHRNQVRRNHSGIRMIDEKTTREHECARLLPFTHYNSVRQGIASTMLSIQYTINLFNHLFHVFMPDAPSIIAPVFVWFF